MPINTLIVDDEKPARDELRVSTEAFSRNQPDWPGKKMVLKLSPH